jgi:hypothetical protein
VATRHAPLQLRLMLPITLTLLLLISSLSDARRHKNRRKNRQHEEQKQKEWLLTTNSDRSSDEESLDRSSSATHRDVAQKSVVGDDVPISEEEAELESAQIAELHHERLRPAVNVSTLRVTVDCTVFDNVAAAIQCINSVRGRRNPPEFTCEDIGGSLKLTEERPFAYGQRKVAYRAELRGVPVVVKRPRKYTANKPSLPGAKSDFAVFRDEAFLFAALVARWDRVDRRTLLDDRGRYLLAPYYYGVCLEAGAIMAVVQRATPVTDVARSLTLDAKATIAVGVLNMALYLRHAKPLGPLVHCDISIKQMALIDDASTRRVDDDDDDGDRTERTLTPRWRPVLLDLDGLHRAPYGSDVSCVTPTHATDLTSACDRVCFKAW